MLSARGELNFIFNEVPLEIHPLNFNKWEELGPFIPQSNIDDDLDIVYNKKLIYFGTGINLYSG